MEEGASSAARPAPWKLPVGEYLLFRNSNTETQALKDLSERIRDPSLSVNDRNKICQAMRFILQSGPLPPFSQFIDNGVLPSLIQFVSSEDHSLQSEAVYMIGLFAQSNSREHTDAVVEAGAVPEIMKLVNSFNDSLSILAIDTLGLLVRRHPELQGICNHLWEPLLRLSKGFMLPTERLLVSRTLTNLFACRPLHLTRDMACQILEAILNFLESHNLLVIAAGCSNFSLISQHEIGNVTPHILSSVCGKLVELLRHDSPQVLLPAFNSVTDIIDDSVEQNANVRSLLIQGMFEHETLKRMVLIIGGEYGKDIKRAVCVTFKFMTKVSNHIQLQAVINSGAINVLVQLYRNSTDDIKVEVARVMLNVTYRGTVGDIKERTGALIEPLFGMLDRLHDHQELALSCLRGLHRIAVLWQRTPRDVAAYRRKLDEIGGEHKLLTFRDGLDGSPAWAADLIWAILYPLR